LQEFLKKENQNDEISFIGSLLKNKKLVNVTSPNKQEFDVKDSYKFNKKISVIILGGGLSGVGVYSALKKNPNFEVTVINKFPYVENVTRVSFIAVDQSMEHLRFNKDDYIVGEVENVSENEVLLKDGKKFTNFDFLILSTGSFYDNSLLNIDHQSLKIPIINGNDSVEFFKNLKVIENAQTIAILGSGGVGIEHLGSLNQAYPHKKIIMISRSKTIMERTGTDKIHNSVLKYFKGRLQKTENVIFKFNETIDSIKENKIITKNEEIQADVILSCIGFTPNTGYLKKDFSKILDEAGYIKVNQNLQVEGFPNIFAMGDITNLKEEKLGQCAMEHSPIVVSNIENVILGKSLKEYKVKPRQSAYALGLNYCILVDGSGGISMEGYLCSYLKGVSKLFISSALK
jgi:apoptosis-inducing factor 2